MKIKLVLLALLLNTCGVRRLPPPVRVVHSGEGWIATGENDKFLLIAKDNRAEAAAIKELCSKEYICFGPEAIGEALLVERRKK